MARFIGIVAGAAFATLAPAACLGGGGRSEGTDGADERRAAGPPRQGGTLTMLWKDDVDSIDPGITYTGGGWLISRATQRTVMAFKPDNVRSPVPDLAATGPRVSADARVVTVRLRAGVRFSPPVGREVRSADVKYAVERGFFATVMNPYAGVHFGDIVGARSGAAPGTRIAGIETPDARTVVFRLRQGTGRGLANALSLPLSAPVPREHALAHDRHSPSSYGMHQVATGPYRIRADARGAALGYLPGQRIHLVRNPSWNRRTDFKPAHVDEVEIRAGNSDDVIAAKRVLRGRGLVSGEAAAPPSVIRQALRGTRDQIVFPTVNGGRWVVLNTKLAPFDDVKSGGPWSRASIARRCA